MVSFLDCISVTQATTSIDVRRRFFVGPFSGHLTIVVNGGQGSRFLDRFPRTWLQLSMEAEKCSSNYLLAAEIAQAIRASPNSYRFAALYSLQRAVQIKPNIRKRT